MSFTGKNAVVTGGAGGIGRCIAEKLAAAGVFVVVIDIAEQVGQFNDKINLIRGDIADIKIIREYVSSLTNAPVDFVINNAGIGRAGLISGCSWEDFEYVQRVSVTAPYCLVSELIKADKLAQNASIVNIASTRAFQSQADTESYSAAKGGIIALTHAMSVSLAGRARVNAISPGWIDASTNQNHSIEDKTQHPAHRIGRAEDIAAAAMFLCDNDRAGFITGENITIDGGMSKLMIYHGDGGWKYNP